MHDGNASRKPDQQGLARCHRPELRRDQPWKTASCASLPRLLTSITGVAAGGGLTEEVMMGGIGAASRDIDSAGLLPTAGSAATCLRMTLAIWWIIHWWFKVDVAGMAATETFFLHYGLPTWLAWFDVSFEIVVIFCLILGLYVPLICIISLPILVAGMVVYRTNGFYFSTGGIEFPIFWAIVQVVQALLGPGGFRITAPAWLPHAPQIPWLAP